MCADALLPSDPRWPLVETATQAFMELSACPSFLGLPYPLAPHAVLFLQLKASSGMSHLPRGTAGEARPRGSPGGVSKAMLSPLQDFFPHPHPPPDWGDEGGRNTFLSPQEA